MLRLLLQMQTSLQDADRSRDRELEEILLRELMGQRKPRNKTNGVVKKSIAAEG